MANKLKELFEGEKEEKIYGTIRFEDLESCKKFKDILDKSFSDGKIEKVKGAKSIEFGLMDGENYYPIETSEMIKDLYVGPSVEYIDFPLQIEGRKDTIQFIKIQQKGYCEIQTRNKAVVDIIAQIFMDQQKIKFTYKTHIENAVDLNSLIWEYKKALAFVNRLFIKEENIPEREELVSSFERAIRYFKRLRELEKVLNIHISPSAITREQDEDYLVEKLYFLLVKGEKIRSNGRLNFIDKVEISNMKEGEEIFGTYIGITDCILFENKFRIYTVNCIFNAIISKIEETNDGRKVYFKDTDFKPMYHSYSGFLSKEKAESELKEILSKKREYETAKGFTDYLAEFVNES